MSDIYVFSPSEDENDYSTLGLVGALTPTECKFSETANGESIVEMSHPIDEFGRYLSLVRGNILSVPVPVRTTPEIEDGKVVTTVWKYEVKPTAQLGSKSYRTLYKAKTGNASIAVMKPGETVTVVRKPSDDAGEAKRWKVKSKYGVGWISVGNIESNAPDGFNLVTEYEIDPEDWKQIEEIESPWTVRPQLFRIYEVKKNIDSIDVSARHISYDLLYNMTKYQSKDSVQLQAALDGILEQCFDGEHGFEAFTNVSNERAGLFYALKNPIEAFLDPEEGICKLFDVSLVRDNRELYFLHDPGLNRGVRIEYGKNMLGVEFTDSDDEVATRIVPTGETKDGKVLYLSEDEPWLGPYVDSPRISHYPVIHITELKCENCKVGQKEGEEGAEVELTEKTAFNRMKAQAEKLIEDGCDVPKIEMSVEFLNLGDTAEYAQFKNLENCFLFDYVTVLHPELKINVTAQIVKIEWDCLLDRMTGVEIGSVGETLANTGITSWQIPSGFSGSKIAGGTIGSGALSDGAISTRHIQADTINTEAIQAGSVTAEKIAAESIQAEHLSAEAIDATLAHITTAEIDWAQIQQLQAAVAEITQATIGTADIDWAHIKDMVTGEAIITKGNMGELYVARLAVTEANMVSLSLGELLLRGDDGCFYAVKVDDEGAVYTEKKVVQNDDIDENSINGDRIIEGSITARQLNVQQIFAEDINVQRMMAAGIDVDTLFAREAFVNLLRTSKIVGEDTLEMVAESTVVDSRLQYYVSNSSVILDGGEWSDAAPTAVPEGRFVWMRTKSVTRGGKETFSDAFCVTSASGAVGPAGVGIAGVDEFFARSSSSTVSNPRNSLTWYPDNPSKCPMSASYPYQWNYERFNFTDGTKQETIPRIIGNYAANGAPGKDGRSYTHKGWYMTCPASDPSLIHFPSSYNGRSWSTGFQAMDTTNKYLWNVEEFDWSDNTVSYTSPIIIGAYGDKGADGQDGKDGAQGLQGLPGTSAYVHIKYSDLSKPTLPSQINDIGGKYVGICTNDELDDPTDPSKYRWSKFSGEDGAPGEPGDDGRTPYVHFKYSNDGGSTFTSNYGETPGAYLGVLADYTQSDSRTPSDYKWAKVRGEDGQDGQNGADGKDGEPGAPGKDGNSVTGVTEYFAVNSDASSAPPLSQFSTERKTMDKDHNCLWNYEVVHITGGNDVTTEPHLIGHFGADGLTYETTDYYLVTDRATGVTRQTSGWSSAVKSTTEALPYLWNYEQTDTIDGGRVIETSYTDPHVVGHFGADGQDGEKGDSAYFHIKYAPNANPSASQMTEEPDVYIGTYVDTNPTDSNDPNDYKWARFQGLQGEKGTDGIPGQRGSDGTTYYLHIKYSNNGGTSFTTNQGEDVGDWIGQCVDTTQADPTTPSSYKWSKIKGDQGEPGQDGQNGKDGKDGQNGADGNGVERTWPQWSLHTSDTVAPAASTFTDAQPAWQPDHYYWTRTATLGTDGSTTYSTPVYAFAETEANRLAYLADQAADSAQQSADAANAQVQNLSQWQNEKDTYLELVNGKGLFVGKRGNGIRAWIDDNGAFKVVTGTSANPTVLASLGSGVCTLGSLSFVYHAGDTGYPGVSLRKKG